MSPVRLRSYRDRPMLRYNRWTKPLSPMVQLEDEYRRVAMGLMAARNAGIISEAEDAAATGRLGTLWDLMPETTQNRVDAWVKATMNGPEAGDGD